jgi:hypothetical protein
MYGVLPHSQHRSEETFMSDLTSLFVPTLRMERLPVKPGSLTVQDETAEIVGYRVQGMLLSGSRSSIEEFLLLNNLNADMDTRALVGDRMHPLASSGPFVHMQFQGTQPGHLHLRSLATELREALRVFATATGYRVVTLMLEEGPIAIVRPHTSGTLHFILGAGPMGQRERQTCTHR